MLKVSIQELCHIAPSYSKAYVVVFDTVLASGPSHQGQLEKQDSYWRNSPHLGIVSKRCGVAI